ncbi:phage gp6-like head-tail connector protein [Lactobacillus reuteri]|uniref:head-tail connector protein n=1 Tax=Limosilactobacillus reuteri TaxID=1598 RepID=UPI00128C5640|nr:head-tail connector protein [Limosilactobacillus reuteri]MQB67129.1 phage gp6-like head-tail connector protein [Limosilactobacillus reuteri]
MSDSIDVSQTVDRVKDVLYLDGNEDDVLLSSYVLAANSFVRNAIGQDVNGFYSEPSVSALVSTAVISLAATYFQNRLSLSDTQTFPIDLTVNSIIGQLRGMRNTFEERNDSSETTDKPAQSSN